MPVLFIIAACAVVLCTGCASSMAVPDTYERAAVFNAWWGRV